jgi:hypothetical protein
MEIRIKINQKLLKQMIELNFNNGRKIQKETFKRLNDRMEWKHRDVLDEIGIEMESQTILQITKSFDFLKNYLKKLERIFKHNKRMNLKVGQFESGYWSYIESNCCPKCNRYGSQLNMDGREYPESFLKKKYEKDFGKDYKDIVEFNGQCEKCGIGFIEVWNGDHSTYHHHEIQ